MPSPKLLLRKATPSDAQAWADCFLDGFSQGQVQQVPFYTTMFPRSPGTRAFFADSFAKQMQEEYAPHFVQVIDENAGDKVIGFAKWTPPGSGEAYWADFSKDMNEKVCNEFFGAMAEHREALMGERPHWCKSKLSLRDLEKASGSHRDPNNELMTDLEVMGVSLDYRRRGVGKMLMQYGCDLIDADGVEAYLDASPLGRGLYEQFGFESRAHKIFDKPFDWYREEFMVRPAKQ